MFWKETISLNVNCIVIKMLSSFNFIGSVLVSKHLLSTSVILFEKSIIYLTCISFALLSIYLSI